jgi:hypothetical protein
MWSEINNILNAVLGNEVKKILCLITVRVKKGKSFAIVNILHHQVMQKGGFADTCFPTDVHMPGDIGLYGSWSAVVVVGANSSLALVSFSYVAGKCRQGYKNNYITAFIIPRTPAREKTS